MTYPEAVDRFVEKLNKADTVYVIEDEELVLEDGVFEGELAHDNVKNESVMVFTGPKMSGERIENFFLSIPSNAPWKRIIKVFANAPKVYVTYETTGDQVEAEDINRVQESIVNTQIELERYKSVNDQAVSDLGTRLSTVESKKADKTYVDAAETNAKAYADSIKPTKVSELENDVNFVTQEELRNAGYGDMLKSVYDTDNDGKVDMAEAADSVPWDGVTGKPGTFPPSSHNHDDRYIKNTGGTIQNGDLYMDGGSVNYVRPDTTGGWARGFWWSKRDLTRIGGIGVLGSGETISKFYIGYGISPWSNSIVEIYPSYINVNGEIKQQGQTVLLKGQPLTWNDLKGE